MNMRVCIYKTDEAPDLTMFLREGYAMPCTEESSWTQLKTITRGEVSDEFLAQMQRTGHCVVRLSQVSSSDRTGLTPNKNQRKASIYHLGSLPSFFRRMLHS